MNSQRKEFKTVIRKGKQHKPRRDATPPAQEITPGAAEEAAEGTQESRTARSAYNLKQLRQMETAGGRAPRRSSPAARTATKRPAKILQAEGPERRTRSRRADPARAAPHLLIFTELILERRRTRSESRTASAGNARGRLLKMQRAIY